MGVLLYLMLSGDVLFGGTTLVCLGVLARSRRSVLGEALVWGGVTVVLASAVPIHPGFYAALCAAAAAWRVSETRNPKWLAAGRAALLTTVTAVTVGAAQQRGGSPLALSREQPVFVIGDSLSAGLGEAGRDAWPELLARTLNVRVENLARAGATLRDGETQARAIPPGPATVFVELGGNDLLSQSSPERFARELRSLLAQLARPQRAVLMFELPLLPVQNAFGRIQRDVCRAHGVLLVPRPILAGAVSLPGHAVDGLHLSPRGHAWLAERVVALWSNRPHPRTDGGKP
jgi:lysophospholipase L1-like esterase